MVKVEEAKAQYPEAFLTMVSVENGKVDGMEERKVIYS